MSTELDPFFTALRRDADELPAAMPDAARRRGRQRRHRTVLAAAVAVSVVLGSVVLLIGDRPGPDEARPAETATTAPTESTGPVSFQPLTPVGPGLKTGAETRVATAVVVGDRAYVGWQAESGGMTSVASLDVTTGRAVWGPIQLASFADTALLFWHPRYLLVIGSHDNGTEPDGGIFVLDRATGRSLLRVDMGGSDDLVLADELLVLASRRDRTTRGYVLATGRVRWTVRDPGSEIVASVAMESPSGPPMESQRNTFGTPGLADRQFVQITADGTAILRDLATGAEVTRRAGAAPAKTGDDGGASVLAVGGVVYAADHRTRDRVTATDLTRSTGTRVVYTTVPGAEVYRPIPCGNGRICFPEQGAPTGLRVVAFDTKTGKEIGRHEGSFTRSVNGQLVLRDYRGPDSRHTVVDADGRQLLTYEGDLGWIDDRTVLLFQQRPNRLLGLSPLDGQPVDLGTLPDLRGCGWSRSHLVCATDTEIKMWRFASG